MASWDFAHCLPYFRRMEDALAAAADDPWRGRGGPLPLERGPAASPLFEAFFAAAQEAGYPPTAHVNGYRQGGGGGPPPTADVNGYRQEGFAAFDRNIRRGRRISAARAYLHPVMRRPNLVVRTSRFVTRILFDGRRAVGGEYQAGSGRGGAVRTIGAGEVILAGGSINTPQLLQVSGIGAAAALGVLGIPAVEEPPGGG